MVELARLPRIDSSNRASIVNLARQSTIDRVCFTLFNILEIETVLLQLLDELMASWLRGMGVIWLTLLTSVYVGKSKGPTFGERSLTLKRKNLITSFLPEVFKGLPPNFLREIEERGKVHDFEKGHVFFKAGQNGQGPRQSSHWVLSGSDP
jgi:hypothetical protein